MTDLNSLDQYLREQEQEEHRLQRGILQTDSKINVVLTDLEAISLITSLFKDMPE